MEGAWHNDDEEEASSGNDDMEIDATADGDANIHRGGGGGGRGGDTGNESFSSQVGVVTADEEEGCRASQSQAVALMEKNPRPVGVHDALKGSVSSRGPTR